MTCMICGPDSKTFVMGLCRRCYIKTRRTLECHECGKIATIHGRGLCSNCYHKLGVNGRKVVCLRCGATKPHYAKRMCKACYSGRNIVETRAAAANPEDHRIMMSDYQRSRRQRVKAKT